MNASLEAPVIHYEKSLRTRGYEADRTATLPIPVYLQHLENVRWEWLMDPDAGFVELMHSGHFFVVLRQTLEIVRRVGMGADLKIIGRIHEVGRSTVRLEHRLIREGDGKLVAQAMVTGAFLGPSRRLARIPDALRELARGAEPLPPVPASDWEDAPPPADLAAGLSGTAFSRIQPPERVYPPLGTDLVPAKDTPPDDAWVHTRVVRPSEIDIFDHVNAATYLRFVDDARALGAAEGALPTRAGQPARRAALAYDREALLGETLEVRVWSAGSETGWHGQIRKAGGDVVTRVALDTV